MILRIELPDSIELDEETTRLFKIFLQSLANRRTIGGLRYGDKPKKNQRYMKRLDLEWAAYKRTGNIEHLFNVAVYCFLEMAAPQHPRSHFDGTVDSVTRKEIGGNIA